MDIFIDWGSTNFRAYLHDGEKVIARKRASDGGTLKGFAKATPSTRAREYSAFLMDQMGDWLDRHTGAVYICGAAGGREGWVETKYSVAPAGIDDIRRSLYKIGPPYTAGVEAFDIYITTGCCIAYPDGRHDVMRSEEVKSLGAALHLGLTDTLLCIPGTHNKWVHISGGKIVHFETAMSGEIFGLMAEKGALAAVFSPSEPDTDFASFDKGMELAAEGFDLLTDIWQVRAQKLRAEAPPGSPKAYFNGILLGHEMRQMEKFFSGKPPVVLLADEGSKRLYYRQAFDRFGWKIRAEVDSETSVCTGLKALK